MSASAPVMTVADVIMKDELASGIKIRAESAADRARIWIQEAVISFGPDPLGGRGLNVAVFNEATGQILQIPVFDTAASDSAAEQFAALIDSLPTGRMVAIATRGDYATHLTERARRACESLGSAQIRNVATSNPWCLVGFKDALAGSVAEAWSPAARASCAYWHSPEPPNAAGGFSLAVGSAGFSVGNRACIVMSGIDATAIAGGLPRYDRGLNVVVFDETSGRPLAAGTFDTNASQAAARMKVS